jgi:hypothetical protein
MQTMEHIANAVHGVKMMTPSKSVFGSDWGSFDGSTSTVKDPDITTAENNRALRNTSLIIWSAGIELEIHTKINKFWTSSFQASH